MVSSNRKINLIRFAKDSGINITDYDLLNIALTHGSYIKEKNVKNLSNNERLEFFGDAVLKLCISEYLMNNYPNYAEGELSNLRAFVVSENVLAKVANKLNIKKYLLLGKSERKAPTNSIISDALEAILAVIYYKCGIRATSDFILKHWLELIDKADKDKEKENFKAVIQEYTQSKQLGLPIYKTISELGPDHKKEFEVAVYLNDHELAKGKGKTKKSASQEAAKRALVNLKNQGKV